MNKTPWDHAGAAESIDTYWRTSPLEIEWRSKLKACLKESKIDLTGHVLDAGCGTGLIYEMLIELGMKPEAYCGIDHSEAMLALARWRHKEAVFMQCPVDEGEIVPEDYRFDTTLCISVLQHMKSYENAIRTLVDVTRSTLYIATWLHNAPDVIRFDGTYYGNTYSVTRMLAFVSSCSKRVMCADCKMLFMQNGIIVVRMKDA